MSNRAINTSSLALRLANLPEHLRSQLLADLTPDQLKALRWEFGFWARTKQKPPVGDWATWLICAGRGFGKTWTGSQWVHRRAMAWKGRWIAMVARTPADARDYMIEGPGGLMKNTPPWERPEFEPSKRRITWPNGSWATIYSDEQPDQLRGFSGDTAWLDEFAKYRNPKDVWENLAFGMREASNDRPRRLITTTPRPIKQLKEIIKNRNTVVTVGTSHENRENLDPKWYKETILEFENTRIGRQEIHAHLLDDLPGALWTSSLLEQNRWSGHNPAIFEHDEWIDSWKRKLARIVIAFDPASTSELSSAEHGIVLGGIDHKKNGYVLEDLSERCTPERAARIMITAYDRWQADRIVGEVNNGGEWIGTVVQQTAKQMKLEGLRSSDSVNYVAVHASRGKRTRAEPISAFDERGLIHHVGMFPEMEDQMTNWDPMEPGPSPDRMDARVWCMTELFLGTGKGRAGVLF